MSVDADAGPGLRERKKAATRQALRQAALEMVAGRGVDDVTVDDIAAACDVSPRTFFNYFPSKEAALVGLDEGRPEDLAERLLARPAGETPLQAVRAVMHANVRGLQDDVRQWRLRLKVIEANPSLRSAMIGSFAQMERSLAAAVAQRTGLDAERDHYPVLVATVSTAALRTALYHWRSAGFTRPLAALLDETFHAVGRGLPLPAETRGGDVVSGPEPSPAGAVESRPRR